MDNTKLEDDFEKQILIAQHELELSRCNKTINCMQTMIAELAQKLQAYQQIDKKQKKKKKKKGKD